MNRTRTVVFIGLLAIAGAFLCWIEQPSPNGPPIDSDVVAKLGLQNGGPYACNIALDLPPEFRQRNWGGGSCVHASTVNLLRWMGLFDLADWWRNQYSGGEYSDRLVKRMEAAGLQYAYTTESDFGFLEWACRTGRGAGIFYKPRHAINCVGMDSQYVYLLDNNATNYPEQRGTYERVPIDTFKSRWRGYGGFAWSLVYMPPAPVPHQ